MFDVDQVITKLDFNNSLFTFVKRQHCIAELGSTVSADAFVDACMLSGSSMLPTLPSLLASRKTPKIRQAFDLINMNGQSGYSACVRFQDDPVVIKLGYIDRYRRKRLAVKHQVYIASSGKVEPFGVDDVPNDLHDVIGQRLPDELYYYLSQGMIGPRVLNQLTTAHIYETCPIDGGESEAYHALVRDKLTPIRETTLSLLASSLSRAYQHREVKISCWFDPEREVSMRLTEVASTKASIKSWNVREDIFKAQDILYTHPASLSAALNSLKDTSFAEKTITPKGKGSIDVSFHYYHSFVLPANESRLSKPKPKYWSTQAGASFTFVGIFLLITLSHHGGLSSPLCSLRQLQIQAPLTKKLYFSSPNFSASI